MLPPEVIFSFFKHFTWAEKFQNSFGKHVGLRFVRRGVSRQLATLSRAILDTPIELTCFRKEDNRRSVPICVQCVLSVPLQRSVATPAFTALAPVLNPATVFRATVAPPAISVCIVVGCSTHSLGGWLVGSFVHPFSALRSPPFSDLSSDVADFSTWREKIREIAIF